MATFEKTLSSKSREDGKREILIRVSAGRGVRFRIKSGCYASAEFWNDETQSVTIPPKRRTNASKVADAQQQQAAIETYSRDLMAIINAAQDAGEQLTKQWIEDCFSLSPIINDPTNRFRPNASQSLFSQINIQRAHAIQQSAIEQAEKQKQEQEAAEAASNVMLLYDAIPIMCQRKQLSEVRTKNYGTLEGQLKRFEYYQQLTKDKSFRLDLETMSAELAEDFRTYLADEHDLANKHPKTFAKILAKYPIVVKSSRKTPLSEGEKPRTRKIERRGGNTIVTQMQKLKSLCNWLYEVGYMTTKPFDSVKVGKERYSEPIYISIEERDKIAALDLSNANEALQVSRDAFILQSLIGCRVADLYRLNEANISGDNILQYTPRKTRDESETIATVPLCAEALAIIEKYKGNPARGNRLLPFVSQQHYNLHIKTIFKMAGITRQVERINPLTGEMESVSIADIASSHMARRTFVGAAYLQTQDPALVGLMSGHVLGSKAFSRYVKRDIDMLRGVIAGISTKKPQKS